jgi:integrase
MAEGIEVRHKRGCSALSGGRCGCSPSYRASAWSSREGKLIRKTFPTKAAAKSWRHDAMVGRDRGELVMPAKRKLRDAAEAWLEGARAGLIRNRSGDPYKPSAIRGYEKALRLRVLPKYGEARLSDLRRIDLQDLVDELVAQGLSASTIDSTLNPVKAIYRHAIARNEISDASNPTRNLDTPAIRSKPKRIADPGEAAKLLNALREADRPIWATALYAGLRRGEIRALRWENVDLAEGLIHVERGWDDLEGPIELKSKAGRRRVPIAGILRDELIAHKLRSDRSAGLVFGRDGETPFDPGKLTGRADEEWTDAGLTRITLHACRHTFASYMIAAGVNAKALSTYMGHANISITLDLYGHLMPGNEGEAAKLLDLYLSAEADREDAKARGEQRETVASAEQIPGVTG